MIIVCKHIKVNIEIIDKHKDFLGIFFQAMML